MVFRDDDPEREAAGSGVVTSEALLEMVEDDLGGEVLEDIDPTIADVADVADGKPLSQWRLFRRRFLRHRLAVAALIVLSILLLSALFAPLITKHDPIAQDLTNLRQPPNGEHWFGTDNLGRDLFARVVYAGRISLKIGFLVSLLSTLIGMIVGSIAGYVGRWVESLLMRITDLFLIIPGLAVLIVANNNFRGKRIFGFDLGTDTLAILILSLLLWTTMARVVRGVVLSLKEKEFVEAARASGASTARIIVRHILPNCIGPIVVNTTLVVGIAILLESTLSFLGFGVQPPEVSWGYLVNDARGTAGTRYAYLIYFPGAAISLTLLAVNFLGDGLRDAFDPTSKH
ncbi:MAG TPA: ABC transporter permease [Acidimicrobiales bacterium]|nr:ABC transporter permease [Acidimicrobiales bacterium]